MNVLITGGAGFIGSHLAERYVEMGCHVSIIDDLSTGSFDNIAHLQRNPGFEYKIDTVLNKPLVCDLVDHADVVFHLAAAVGVRLIVERSVRTIATNVHGTEIVLDAAARKKKRIVIASSSEVYGKSDQVPFSEDDDLVMGPTVHGRWSYACSKMLDESLGLAYFREQHLPLSIVRLFNTAGPRQNGQYGMVIPTFVQQAVRGLPITVYGDGTQSRCFVHVKDAVEAMARIIETNAAVGEVYNVGNDREITIEDLAKMVKDRATSTSKIVHVSYQQAYGTGFEDLARRVPSLLKLEKTIGYRPTTDLEEIVDAVIEETRACLRSAGSAVPAAAS